MLEVKALEIAGFCSVLQALRLPFGKECRSSCNFYGNLADGYDRPCFESRSAVFLTIRT